MGLYAPPKFPFPTIRTQTILVSVVALAFLLLLLALALLLQDRTIKTAAWSQHSEEILTQAETISKTVGAANEAVVQYAAKRNPASLRAHDAAERRLRSELRNLQTLVGDEPAQRVRAQHLALVTASAMQIIDQYLDMVERRDAAGLRALQSSPRIRTVGTALQNAFAAFNDSQRALMIARSNAVRKDVQGLGLALIVTSVAGILVSLLVSARFGLSIVRRLEMLADNARRLAVDEPTQPLEGTDEIAALDRVYHQMTRRIQREHHVASTLQRVLLPQDLPKIPGLRIDTAYVPAAKGAEVGGDWYDVFAVSDRHICIGVGDVAGHGLRAASVMGTARLAIRTAARIENDPSAILDHVNRVLCADEPDVVVTAFLGMLDLADGTLTYAIAGHPAPVHVRPGGVADFLPGGGLLLGLDPHAAFERFEARIGEGSAIVLYTDGIVEVERDYFKGLADLLQAVRVESSSSAENIAEAVQRRIFARSQPRDDCALLFLGVTALGAAALAPMRRTWTIDAREESASRRIKRALLWHLGEIASTGSDFDAVELIFGELIGNVARHTPGRAEISLSYEDGSAILRISDNGSPFAPPGNAPDVLAEGGRGLFLVRAMARELRIEHNDAGNHVSAVLPVRFS